MIIKLLQNRTFILGMAFVLGLIFGDVAAALQGLTMPALAVVLAVSATQITVQDFLPIKEMARPLVLALAANFLFLGTVILLLAWWLMPTWDLWVGYVLVATAPPGIAIVPFTHVLKGNLRLSLLGTFGVYLISLFLTPLLIYLFTGEAAISPLRLLNTMVFLILVPFIVSQFLRKINVADYLARLRGSIINWGFFVVIFSVVGLNQDVFLQQHEVLVPVSVVAIISSFVLAVVVGAITRKLKLSHADQNSFILLSTIKTSAFAAAVGVSLYSEAASIPGAVVSFWYAIYFILLGIKGDKKSKLTSQKD